MKTREFGAIWNRRLETCNVTTWTITLLGFKCISCVAMFNIQITIAAIFARNLLDLSFTIGGFRRQIHPS